MENGNTTQDQMENKKWWSKIWNIMKPTYLCPTNNISIKILTMVFLLVCFICSMISLLGNSVLSIDAPIFQLLFLFVIAMIAGKLVEIIKLPPLLGMLISGIVLKNVGLFTMTDSYIGVVRSLRLLAMVTILTKAGLGLDANVLKKLSCLVLRLAFCPCTIEALTIMFVAKLLLDLPWAWALLLGFILAAVSPAVVVPSLLRLKSLGYGEDKGISTLVIAASSIDDIAAISAFGIILGIIFAKGNLTEQILHGPLEVVIGITFGCVYSLGMIYIPHSQHNNNIMLRTLLVAFGGIIAVFGAQRIGFDGAGPLACIVAAFVAACGWRTESPIATKPIEKNFSNLWELFQPILFSLIGTEILFSELKQNTILLGLAVLFCGLILRIITVGIITHGSILNLKEQIFIAIAWLPKATVQAALAPVALDLARNNNSTEDIISYSEQVLSIAVLAILVTAPIGAVGISLCGPRLLERIVYENDDIYYDKQDTTSL